MPSRAAGVVDVLEHHELTADVVRHWLDYDPETGALTWRRPWGLARVGALVGVINHHGYRVFGFRGKQRQAHRIAWLHYHGEMPLHFIDHVNGVRDDNRICNMRNATPEQNSQNKRVPMPSNRTGLMGVTLHKKTGRWQSAIGHRGTVHYLGLFDSPEAAHAAYLVAKRRLHPFSTLPEAT